MSLRVTAFVLCLLIAILGCQEPDKPSASPAQPRSSESDRDRIRYSLHVESNGTDEGGDGELQRVVDSTVDMLERRLEKEGFGADKADIEVRDKRVIEVVVPQLDADRLESIDRLLRRQLPQLALRLVDDAHARQFL